MTNFQLPVVTSAIFVFSVALLIAQFLYVKHRGRVCELVRDARGTQKRKHISIWNVCCASVLGLIVLGFNPFSVLALVLIFAGVTVFVRQSRRRKAQMLHDEDLMGALLQAGQMLRAGGGLFQALQEAADRVGPSQTELQQLVRGYQSGNSLHQAVDNWQRSSTVPAVSLTASALLLTLDSGGSPARAIEAGVTALRHAHRSSDLARSQSAQAHSSAKVLSILPMCVLIFFAISNSQTRDFLLYTNEGGGMLLMGVVLDALGVITMQWMIGLMCS